MSERRVQEGRERRKVSSTSVHGGREKRQHDGRQVVSMRLIRCKATVHGYMFDKVSC